MNLNGKKINFLGDSITEGVGTSAPEKRYPDLIAADCGCIVRNYGISGTRIARQYHPTVDNPSFDLDFPSRVADMDPDADIIVVFGGTNDFGHGDAPFGDFSDRTADTFCGAIHELYVSLLEKYPTATIMVITPLHRLNEDSPIGDNKPAPVGTLKEYTEIIREVAQWYSLPVLDLFAMSGMQPRVPVIQEKFVPDGLHPNDDGNRKLADLLISFLSRL